MSGPHDLVERLREQAQASGHVWVDVMLLLLEAANELERKSKLYMGVANELDDLKMAL